MLSNFLNGSDHFRMSVAQDHGPPGADKIDVSIAIDIGHLTAPGGLDDNWVAAHSTKGANRTVHPTGEVLFGFAREALRLTMIRRHGLSLGPFVKFFSKSRTCPSLVSRQGDE